MDGVIHGGEKRPPRIMLYGPPKVGKSSFGAGAPKPIFITTEDGVDSIGVDYFKKAETWVELIGNINKVIENKGEYETAVIDTISGAIELAAEYVCKSKFGGDWGESGFSSYGKGVFETRKEMAKLLPLIDKMRNNGMNVILLAHAGVTTIRNPVAGDFQRYAPNIDKNIWADIAARVDIIMRADYEYTVLGAKPDKNKPGRAVGQQTRVIYCHGSVSEDVGTRVGFDLPDTIELSWESFASNLNKEDDVIPQIELLWKLLDEKERQATWKWLKVKELKEATREKLKVLLNKLVKRQSDLSAKEAENKKEE